MLSVLITTLVSLSYRRVLGAARLTVTTGEEFTVPLPSLLPGCDLVFNVTTSEGLTAEVEDPDSLVLLATIARRNVGDFACAPLPIFREGDEYVLSEDGNLLVATEIKATGDIQKIWDFPISAEGVVRGLEVQNLNGVHQLFVLLQTANSHYEVHTIELQDITIRPNSTVKLDLPESDHLTSVLFSTAISYDQSLTVVLAGHSPQLEAPGRNSLFIYRLSQKRELNFVREINSYSEMSLNIVSLSSANVIVYVLDLTLGLMTLDPMPQKTPTLRARVDLSGYGEPISFRVPAEKFKYIMIVTTVGLVVVDMQRYAVRSWLENLSLCNEPWTLSDAEFSEQYFFTTGVTAEDTYFQVARTHSPIVSRSWRLSDLIPRGMINPQSPVLLHQLIHLSRYHVIRSDKDALRVFRLELGIAEMRARAHRTGEFTAVITGSQRFYAKSIESETIAVESLAPANTTILLGTGYSLDSVAEIQTYTRKGQSATFSVNPKALFSGPDLHYSASLANITEGAIVSITPIPPEVSDIGERESCAVSRPTLFAAALSVVLAIEDGELVVIVDPMKKENCRRAKIEGMKILHVCQGCTELIVLAEIKSGDRLIAKLDPRTYQPVATIGVAACDRIRFGTTIFLCITPASITFVSSSLRFLTTITAETLGLPALDVVDAALQYSEYSSMNYVFITCSENGLFLVSMPYLEPPKLVQFIDSESGLLHLHSSYLCRITATGETTIFDAFHTPAVRAIRTLPAWSPGAVTAVFGLQFYIWVEKEAVGYLLNVEVPAHTALVAVLNFAPGCRHVTDGMDLYEICQSEGWSNVSRKVVTIPANQDFSGGMELIAEIDAKNAGSGLYRALLEVKAENSFGEHAQRLVAFELIKE